MEINLRHKEMTDEEIVVQMKKIYLIWIFVLLFLAFAMEGYAQRLTTFNTSFTGTISTNPSDYINNTQTGVKICGGYFPNISIICNPISNTSAFYTTQGTNCLVDRGIGFFRVSNCDVGQTAGLFSGGTSPLLPRGTGCDFIYRTSGDTFVQMGLDDDTGYVGSDDTQITAGSLGSGGNARKTFLHFGSNLFSSGAHSILYDKENNLTVVSNYSAGEGKYNVNNTEAGEAGVGGIHCENCNLSALSSPQNPAENADFNLTWFVCYNISKGIPQA